MRAPIRLFTALCLSAAIPALAAQAPDAPAASTTFTMPPAWTRAMPVPTVTVLSAPEDDYHVALVEVGPAADAKEAASKAWATYRPAGARKVKLVTDRPGRNGWDKSVVIDYETSPNEHFDAQAVARVYQGKWTVAIVEGNSATGEKRAAATSLVFQSMRPAGYQREMFTGRTAHALTPDRVAQLVDFVRHAADKLHTPGVGLALIDHGKIVYEGGVGVKEVGKTAPIDAHTKFIIASNTKSMATLLLAKAVDKGLVRWDQKVVDVYPSFRLGSDATTNSVLIRHLVCACTGLPRKDFEMLFTTTRDTPASDTFKILAGTEPTSGFGETFQYNNLMASAAGYIAAHLFHPDMEVGAAFDRALKEEILDPLGMKDTSVSMTEGPSGDFAQPHGRDVDGKVVVTGQDLNWTFYPFRPAGGGWSSPHDMIRYVQNELNQGRLANGTQLVSAQNLLARREHGVPVGEDHWYGMGLMDDRSWGVSVIHHGGDLEGYHSDMYMIPEAGVGAVLLTNSDDGPPMRRPFMRRLLEVLYDGKPEALADVDAQAKRQDAAFDEWRGKLVTPIPADVVAGLAPAYVSPDLGRIDVERANGKVHLRLVAWHSEASLRRNDDKTLSLVTTSPGFQDLDLVIGTDNAGKRTLTTRDGQHVYVFTEVTA
jgi:CubicO group peptidase (beta-lactamase class C family)